MIGARPEAGLGDPRFDEIATRLRVTIFRERVARPCLGDTGQAIVDALSDGDSRLTSEVDGAMN
jgi:hypothetical protein